MRKHTIHTTRLASDLRIAELMSPNPVVVDTEATLSEAREILRNYRFRHLPVISGNAPVGMLSDRDFRLASCLRERALGKDTRPADPVRRVTDVMSQPVVALAPDDAVAQAAETMLTQRLGAVAVVDKGELVGILTESDLLSAFLESCRLSDFARDDLVRYRMHQPAPLIGPGVDVVEAFDQMDPGLGHLVVVQNGTMVGFASARDLLGGMARAIRSDQSAEVEGTVSDARIPVSAVMSKHVVTTAPGDSLSRAAAAMLGHKFSALPVIADGEVVGVLTQRHLLSHFVENR